MSLFPGYQPSFCQILNTREQFSPVSALWIIGESQALFFFFSFPITYTKILWWGRKKKISKTTVGFNRNIRATATKWILLTAFLLLELSNSSRRTGPEVSVIWMINHSKTLYSNVCVVSCSSTVEMNPSLLA